MGEEEKGGKIKKERERERRKHAYGELGCMKRRHLIKIWSNIKTSSCFHLVAACQDYLAEEDETSGPRKGGKRCQISKPLYRMYPKKKKRGGKGEGNRQTTVLLSIKPEPVTDIFIMGMQSRSLLSNTVQVSIWRQQA